jgi:hypothetical protein
VSERALPRPAGPAARLRAAVDSPAAVTVVAAVVILAAFVSWVLLDRYVLAPWIMEDELRYASSARSFISVGHYLFREHPDPLPTIYPALISPAWLAGSVHTSYTLTKAINAAMMTAGAIPLFLWARRLAAPIWALLAVVLYLAMPDFAYTGEILSDNAYVPAVILALFAIAAAIERPTILRQLLALGAIALAVAARLQGLVLVPVLVVAIGLALLFDAIAALPAERRRVVVSRLRSFWPTFAVLALGLVLYVVYEAARGGGLRSGLGGYQSVSHVHYSLRPVVRWSAYTLGELSWASGLLPVAALIVLVGLACRRATAPSPAERAFLAVAAPFVLLTVIQVGAFASHFSLRVEERNAYNVLPVLFLALAVWLGRGLPRPPALTAAAIVAPVAFLLALPWESLVSTGAFFTDTLSLIPLWRLSSLFSGGTGDVRILTGLGALVAAILFASIPRRWAVFAVPVAVVGFLVLSAGSVFAQVTFHSRATRFAGGLSGDPSWIDHAVGKNARVQFLYTTDIDVDQHILWQSEFWNRSVRRVFGVTSQDPSIPDISAPLDPTTGLIRPNLPAGSPDAQPRYVAAASNVAVAGKRIASSGYLSLYRVKPPLGLTSLVSGLTPDAWTGPTATYTRFRGLGQRRLNVLIWRPKLTGPPPAHVTATVIPLRGGSATQTEHWTLKNGTRHLFALRLPPGPFRVQLAVDPTFVPSQYGLTDTRTLGVHASFGAP